MADKLKKLSLEEEEKLAFEVKKYPCLFDKRDKGHKEKDCVSNAWEEVSNSLDFIQNGNTAKSLFERLRKRYNKKKNDVKKSKRSGSGARESEKAENALRVYQFLFWLDSFTYLRESRTNINDNEDDGGEEEDDDDNEEAEEGEPTIESDVSSIGSDDENESSDERSVLETSKASSAANSPVVSVVSGKQKVKKAMKRKVDESSSSKEKSKKEGIRKGKTSKSEYLDEMELNLIQDLGKSMKKEQDPQKLDDVDVYVRSLAVDLRKLSERDYMIVKHEIQGILLRYQMAKFRPTTNEGQSSQQNVGYYTQWMNN